MQKLERKLLISQSTSDKQVKSHFLMLEHFVKLGTQCLQDKLCRTTMQDNTVYYFNMVLFPAICFKVKAWRIVTAMVLAVAASADQGSWVQSNRGGDFATQVLKAFPDCGLIKVIASFKFQITDLGKQYLTLCRECSDPFKGFSNVVAMHSWMICLSGGCLITWLQRVGRPPN